MPIGTEMTTVWICQEMKENNNRNYNERSYNVHVHIGKVLTVCVPEYVPVYVPVFA